MAINWKRLTIWGLLTVVLAGLALPVAFYNLQTALVCLLIYVPLTGAIVWLTVYRRKIWMLLWLVVFLGWLSYIGPFISDLFSKYSIGDTF